MVFQTDNIHPRSIDTTNVPTFAGTRTRAPLAGALVVGAGELGGLLEEATVSPLVGTAVVGAPASVGPGVVDVSTGPDDGLTFLVGATVGATIGATGAFVGGVGGGNVATCQARRLPVESAKYIVSLAALMAKLPLKKLRVSFSQMTLPDSALTE